MILIQDGFHSGMSSIDSSIPHFSMTDGRFWGWKFRIGDMLSLIFCSDNDRCFSVFKNVILEGMKFRAPTNSARAKSVSPMKLLKYYFCAILLVVNVLLIREFLTRGSIKLFPVSQAFSQALMPGLAILFIFAENFFLSNFFD